MKNLFFTLIDFCSASHWGPFSQALCDRTSFCHDAFPGVFLLNCLAHFRCHRYQPIFSPINKTYLICCKEFSSFEKAPQLWDTEVFMNFTKETNIKVCYTDVVQQYKAYGKFQCVFSNQNLSTVNDVICQLYVQYIHTTPRAFDGRLQLSG